MPKSFLDECLTVAEYAAREDRSRPWVYWQIEQGLPVVRTGRRNGIKIHPSVADEYYRSRMTSKRKPAKARRDR